MMTALTLHVECQFPPLIDLRPAFPQGPGAFLWIVRRRDGHTWRWKYSLS